MRILAQRLLPGGARAWFMRQELGVLVAMLAVAAGLLAFVTLAAEVGEGETRAFDTFLLLSLRSAADPADPIGPRWFEEMMRDFTALGGTGVLTAVTVAAIGYLVLTRKRHAAITVAVAIVTALLLSHALKWGFARPRPELVPHGQVVYSRVGRRCLRENTLLPLPEPCLHSFNVHGSPSHLVAALPIARPECNPR